MILEHADLSIAPGKQAEFEEAIARGVATVIARSAGFRGSRVHKGIESPERYLLLIQWDSVQHHLDFRAAPAFAQWRAIVGPFFTKPPVVEHFDLVAESA